MSPTRPPTYFVDFSDLDDPAPAPDGQTWYRSDTREFWVWFDGKAGKVCPGSYAACRTLNVDRWFGKDLGGVACEVCGYTLIDHVEGKPCVAGNPLGRRHAH